MANEIGTATNFEDFFSKIVAFLTTNATLVAAGQAWQALRVRRDNIATHTSNLTDPTAAASRKMIHTFRYDPRTLNTDNPADSGAGAAFYTSNLSVGVSFNSWEMRTAREVKNVLIRSHPTNGTYNSYAPRSFRLQYSDNGTSWTTALTVTNTPAFSLGERRLFAVPGTPGAHLHWRILWDAVQSGTTNISWSELLLLEADGTVANHFGSEVILKALGNSGLDEIYTGIRSEYDSAAGWYNLFMNGYTGYDANEMSWFNQPGALYQFGAQYPLAVPMVPLWNAAMPYWFVASGRSFRFAVKVSTSYEGGYLGFILPYATPNQFPYPLAVGGSLVPQVNVRSAEWRYSYANWRHGVYPGPGADSSPSSEGRWATLYLRNPDGEWGYFANRPNNGLAQPEGIYGPTQSYSIPFSPSSGWRSVWPHCMNDQWTAGKLPYRDCLGGGYVLQPCVLLQRAPFAQVFGELEGTFSISGYQNAAENTTIYNGKTHVVFQQAYRNSVHEFWALSMD
ncbi:virion structural protein [Pseudomonas phage Epa38]|nr:virion structural protein [Pseudomonas phage Epa38]